MTKVIRYYGHVGQSTGYGRAATELCAALLRLPDVNLQIRPLAPVSSLSFTEAQQDVARRIFDDSAMSSPDAVIVHTLPLDCARVRDTVLDKDSQHLGGPTRVARVPWFAYTTWEATTAPPELLEALFYRFHRVWVPSMANLHAFSASGIGRETPFTPDVLPHCFDESTLDTRRGRNRLGGPFRFYYVGAWNQRKNPFGVVRAFAHEFDKSEPVELVLQCSSMKRDAMVMHLGALGIDQAKLPAIRPSIDQVSDQRIDYMHRAFDCFVTASRGEAWNLPAFDASLAQRHVIAPALQGSDDFLEGTTANLYDSSLSPAIVDVTVKELDEITGKSTLQTVGAQGLTCKQLWREPNLMQLAEDMRHVFKDQRDALMCRYDPREVFGYQVVAQRAHNLMFGS